MLEIKTSEETKQLPVTRLQSGRGREWLREARGQVGGNDGRDCEVGLLSGLPTWTERLVPTPRLLTGLGLPSLGEEPGV